MSMIQRTQIFFDDNLKTRKEEAGLTWNEAAILGIQEKEKNPNLKITNGENKNGKH